MTIQCIIFVTRNVKACQQQQQQQQQVSVQPYGSGEGQQCEKATFVSETDAMETALFE